MTLGFAQRQLGHDVDRLGPAKRDGVVGLAPGEELGDASVGRGHFLQVQEMRACTFHIMFDGGRRCVSRSQVLGQLLQA